MKPIADSLATDAYTEYRYQSPAAGGCQPCGSAPEQAGLITAGAPLDRGIDDDLARTRRSVRIDEGEGLLAADLVAGSGESLTLGFGCA
jgi:hypothetical protein